MHTTNVLTFAVKVKTSAIANPSTISHRGVVGLALWVGVWPWEANKMVVVEADTRQLEGSLERTHAIKIDVTHNSAYHKFELLYTKN